MSRTLALLLGKPKEDVTEIVMKLEDLSGYPSEDVRLLAHVQHGLLARIAELKLDPHDTTGPELYYALREKAREDSSAFAGDIGSPADKRFIKTLGQLFAAHTNHQETWALKRSVAKELLHKHPPKRLMKYLHYRSVESMLKRENICELYAAAAKVETASWLGVFQKDQTDLAITDFESRNIEVIQIHGDKWKNIGSTYNITTVPVLGVIVVWQTTGKTNNTLSAAVSFSRAITNIRDWSYAAQKAQLEEKFKEFMGQKKPGKLSALLVKKDSIPWSAIFKHNVRGTESEKPFEDLSFELPGRLASPLEVLSNVKPSLKWWSESEYLGRAQKELPLSLNIFDVLRDFSNDIPYRLRTSKALGESLWDEVISRYLEYPGVKSYILRKLESKMNALPEYKSELADIVTANQKIEWA